MSRIFVIVQRYYNIARSHATCRATISWSQNTGIHHLATLKNCALFLRYIQRCTTFVRLLVRSKCDERDRKRSRHPKQPKITCNDCDRSCNECDRSYDLNKTGSQSVLRWSCANCERGFRLRWFILKSLIQRPQFIYRLFV